MKKNTADISFIIIFTLIFLILDILFFPVLVNKVLLPLLTQNKSDEFLHLLDWKSCFINTETVKITAGFEIMLISGFIGLLVSDSSRKLVHGDEHGSARLLTDKEFDKLIPFFVFKKDIKDE